MAIEFKSLGMPDFITLPINEGIRVGDLKIYSGHAGSGKSFAAQQMLSFLRNRHRDRIEAAHEAMSRSKHKNRWWGFRDPQLINPSRYHIEWTGAPEKLTKFFPTEQWFFTEDSDTLRITASFASVEDFVLFRLACT